MTPAYAWRGDFDNAELNALHAEAFEHPLEDHDWWGQVSAHSLGWVTARHEGALVGFVNVAWDGAGHAFILDTIVSRAVARRGVGTGLVAVAARKAAAAGCETLHVDFAEEHRPFYIEACGFQPTPAGIIVLRG